MTKKMKSVMLLALLVIVVAGGGVTLFLTNKDDNSPQEKQEPQDVSTLAEGDIENVEGYYEEKQVYSAPWDYWSLDGRLFGRERAMYYKEQKVYDLSTEEELIDLSGLNPISGLYVADDLSYATVWVDQETKKVYFEEFDKKGKSKNVVELQNYSGRIEKEEGEAAYTARIEQMEVDDNYIYIMMSAPTQPVAIPHLLIYQRDGSLHATYENVGRFDIDGEGYIYICSDNLPKIQSGYQKIQVSTKEIVYTAANDDLGVDGVEYEASKNHIYLLASKGVKAYDAKTGAKLTDLLVFGSDSSMIKARPLHGYLVMPDRSVYISYGADDGGDGINIIYQYVFQKGKRPEPSITLTLKAPYRDDFMEEAIGRFQRLHPDIGIQYEYEYNTKDSFDQAYGKISFGGKYAEQLVLEILAGDAGDIVQTGGSKLAYRELFMTDAFLDLKDLLEQDEIYDQLNQSALKGLTIQGAIRGVPVGTTNIYIEMDKTLWDSLDTGLDCHNLTWSNVLDIYEVWKEKYPGRPFISVPANGAGVTLHVQSFLISNMPDLINIEEQKVDLRQEWFLELLKRWKTALQDPQFILPFEHGSLDWLKGGLFRQGGTGDNSMRVIMFRYGDFNLQEGVDTVYLPMFRGEKNRNHIASSQALYSISSASEHPTEAWKFLRFLMTEQAQSFLTYKKNYTNIVARDKAFLSMEREGNTLYGKKADEYFDSIRELQASIDYLYTMDYYIQDLLNPINDYFNDKLTLDEAIAQAEQSIWIRMNE